MRTIVRIIHTWFTFSVRVIGKRGHGALCISLLASAACLPAHAGSVAYKYDTLGRLSTATYNNGAVIAYAYDAAGNRTSHTVTGAPAAAAATALKTPGTTATTQTTKTTKSTQ